VPRPAEQRRNEIATDAQPEMKTNMNKSNDSSGKLPCRGKVLCIFDERRLVETIEPAVTAEGYTLLRARHGMHGYWMAITGTPDVIITDVPDEEIESNYLLECLNRNAKTREIPVIAMVNARQQSKPTVSCLRHVQLCVTKGISPSELLKQADDIIERNAKSKQSATAEAPVRTNNVDAVFSELGHTPTKSPNIARHIRQPRAAGVILDGPLDAPSTGFTTTNQ
jgi:response regulator RpfG family c-di-GMP phosphodiesterase